MNGKVFAVGFILAAALASVAYAATVSQIWNAVYDSSTNSLRVVGVP